MADANDNTLEIEREKTKQLKLQVKLGQAREATKQKQETFKAKKAKWDHEYRMQQLNVVGHNAPLVVANPSPEEAQDTKSAESVAEPQTTEILQTDNIVAQVLDSVVEQAEDADTELDRFIGEYCSQGLNLQESVTKFLADFKHFASSQSVTPTWLNEAMRVRRFPKKKLSTFNEAGKRPLVYAGIASNYHTSG